MMSNFTQIDFEKYLTDMSPNFRRGIIGKELSYQAPLIAAPSVDIRILSSIDARTKESRKRGKDAIRVHLVHNNKIVGSSNRTNRVPGWQQRLKKKMIELGRSIVGWHCPDPDCAGYMTERKNQNGELFYGCTCYPNCKATQSYERVWNAKVKT